MRILTMMSLFLLLLAGAASAHCGWGNRCGWGDRCGDRHWRADRGCCDGQGWHAHRRWYRHGHAACGVATCGAPHHRHVSCATASCAGAACTICLKDFPANPRDGQEVWVRGVRWEWDADDHRWELD